MSTSDFELNHLRSNSGNTAGTVLLVRPLKSQLGRLEMTHFRELLQGVKDPYSRLLVDLTEVKKMDSSFLGGLLFAHRNLPPDGEMHVCGMNDNILRIFHLTRLSKVFSMHETYGVAIDGLGLQE